MRLLNPLPQDSQGSNGSPLRGKRVAVVLFSSYPGDPRPRRAAEALIREGMSVELFCLRLLDAEATREQFGGVDILRLPMKHRRGGKIGYAVRYLSFILMSAWMLAYRSLTRRYDLVHVHNMPDALVFSALIPKLLGARVILDLHDPMPELIRAIFGVTSDTSMVRLLKFVEKRSVQFADRVLTVNQACVKIFASRSCPAEKIQVVMNAPDERIFGFRPHPGATERDSSKPFVLMYHGSIVERHGLDLAVQALAMVRPDIPRAELRIYGQSTPFLEEVMGSAAVSSMRDAVHYLGPQSLEQIVQAIDQCDVGVIPNRRSIFTEINTPTRIFEYLARGRAVIAPASAGIQDYFGPQDLVFFELGDATDLANKIRFVHAHPTEVAAIVQRGQEVYRAHQWGQERARFLEVVSGLVRSGTG